MTTAELETCTVTGPVLPPDGAPVGSGTVTFTLSALDRDGEITVMPAPVTAEIDEEGNISVDLWPNAAGYAGTFYTAKLVVGRTTYPSWRVVVPELPTANLADISQLSPPDRVDDAEAAAQEAQEALSEIRQLVFGSGVQAIYVSSTPPNVAGGAPYLWVEDFGDGQLSTLWLEEGGGPSPGRPLHVGSEQPSVPNGIPYLWIETEQGSDVLTLWLEDGNGA